MQWNELPALFILDYCEMYSSNILCQSSQSQRKLSDLMKVRTGKSESLSDPVVSEVLAFLQDVYRRHPMVVVSKSIMTISIE